MRGLIFILGLLSWNGGFITILVLFLSNILVSSNIVFTKVIAKIWNMSLQ